MPSAGNRKSDGVIPKNRKSRAEGASGERFEIGVKSLIVIIQASGHANQGDDLPAATSLRLAK